MLMIPAMQTVEDRGKTVDAQADAGAAAPAPEGAEQGRVFTARLFRVRRGCSVTLATEPEPVPRTRAPVRSPARVAIMLALAHRIQRAIDTCQLADAAEVARRLGLTRARVSQLLNLTLLPVAQQERILLLEAVDGRQPTSERALRQPRPRRDLADSP
jgi:predicted XRE-type DNA-binding protein